MLCMKATIYHKSNDVDFHLWAYSHGFRNVYGSPKFMYFLRSLPDRLFFSFAYFWFSVYGNANEIAATVENRKKRSDVHTRSQKHKSPWIFM